MGNRRKSSGPGGAEVEPNSPEVTGTLIKSLLTDPQSTLRGLEQFVSVSRKLPSPHLYDVVEGYLKISLECIEILKLLDGERRPESEIILIFQALEAILLRTASDLSHLSVAGVNIVKKMLDTHMKLIYASVYSETHRVSRICFNLLSAMVTQGPDCARSVFSHFDFNNKFLPGLLKKRDKQGRPDVRMACIQFALSFLICGDNTTIVQVLELKDFFSAIFSTGLKDDRISTINLLLSLLQSKVVQNKAITKTQKLRFFTSIILNHIASLYRWSGIVDVSTKDVQGTNDPKEAGKVMIRELVHKFLLDLCCSLKHGITFHDPSLGTAARAGNLVLLRFLVGLKSATEDELVGELVVNILKVCPDLLNRYFKEIQYSFAPRLKSAWLDNIKLLKKIYEAQPPISVAFKTTEFVPLPRLINMVMITTVAPVCTRTMFTQGLNVPNKIVKHTTLSLMSSVLQRAKQNIDHCLKEEAWQKSDLYTPATMAEFAQKYRESLSKLLPDVNTIVATWQSLLKQEEADGEKGKKLQAAGGQSKTSESEELAGLTEGKDDAVQNTFVKASLLRVLCLYQRVVPHLVSQSNFDFSKLLKGIVSESGVCEEVPPVLQHQILQVALELPASKFSWFKVQEPRDVGGEKSVFYLLLKMFVTCKKLQLKTSTRLLVIKILRDSGVFEYTWSELELWLRCLDKVEENSQEAVIHFLEQTLVKLVSNPYPYTDKATDYVQEAWLLQTGLGKPDSDAVSIPISHIDEVMDMVDVIVEGSEGLDEEVGHALDEEMTLHTFPFSAMVPVTLETRNSLLASGKARDECVIQYLVSVLTDILHAQRDPLALCLALQSYDKDIQSSDISSAAYILLQCFYNYYSLWLPPSTKESLFAAQDSHGMAVTGQDGDSSYDWLLRKVCLSDHTADDCEAMLKDSISQIPQGELLLAVRHTLLCLKTTVDNFKKLKKNSGASLVSLLLDLLGGLLCQYQQACTSQTTEEEKLSTESELFKEDNTSALASTDNMVLDTMLSVVFKHPTLESWFLALERQSVPPHNLKPACVRLLSSQMNQGLLQLLKSSTPLLQQTNNLHLVAKYFDAISVSVLKELESPKKTSKKISLPIEALESLHPNMDTAQLNDLTLSLLKLSEEYLLEGSEHSTDQQLSAYGKVLVLLLNDRHQRKQCQEDLAFSVEHVRGVGHLLSTSAGPDLEPILSNALQKEPAFAHVVGVDVLTHCLRKMTKTSLAVVALLVQHSRIHRLQFELWCLNPGSEKHLRKKMETCLPLINGYLETRKHFPCTQLSKVSSAVIRVLKDVFWNKLVKTVLSAETSGQTSEQVALLSKLAALSEMNELKRLMDELPEILGQSSSQEKWALADCVSQAADCAGVNVGSWQPALLAASMKCLTATYGTHKEPEEAAQEAEINLLSRLKNLMLCVREDVPAEWNSLVRAGLKYRFKDCAFLDALRTGIEQWYDTNGPCMKELVQLPVVHMMVTQHSLFLPCFLRSREEEDACSDIREKLVDLLRCIVSKCPSVCDKNHFVALLGAYGASLCVTDQKILFLLQAYEQNNVSLADFRLLLWGPAAVEHHKTRKSLGKSLWQQPSMEEILSLLDREKMMETILNFPLHLKLTAEAGKNVLYEDSAIKDLHNVYDPCFLLPLFSDLLRPELVVDCMKFAEVNALGLTLAALSSYDYSMRAAANHVLGSFVSHMEGARFRHKEELLYVLDVLKNGIRQENYRLTFSLALYSARAAQQILRPEEHMYIKITKFLLSHEYLDLNKVPDFYRLFFSSDIEHKAERRWILTLLSDGMRDKYCYELYDYQRIFMVLMTFYTCPLCDETLQNQIMEIFLKASKVPKAAYELLRDHSLLTWILNILGKWYIDYKALGSVIALINSLWFTNLGKKEKAKSRGRLSQDGATDQEKFLPLHLVNEYLGVLMAVLRHIRANVDGVLCNQYFSTFSSVLRYRTRVLEAFKEMGRFAINEQVLSSKHALLLLQKWSVIEKDLGLQENLTAVAKEHRVKELISTIKEKFRQPGPRRLRKKIEAVEEANLEPQPASNLEDSKNHVKSILLHWEPTFLNSLFTSAKERIESTDQPNETTAEDSEATSDSATDNLACATACLVAKWIITIEGDLLLSSCDLYRSLHWLETCILPHTAVVQELLSDHILRSTLYKLYYRVYDSPHSSLDLLRLANQVMMKLIKTQNLGTDIFHIAVKNLCLPPEDNASDMRKAAANFLVSLYVGDIWLGAQAPVMFKTYVKMVCDAADVDTSCSEDKTPKRKKRREEQEAIVSLCKDLSATLPKT